MSAEVIGLKGDTVPNVISAFTVAAARTMKTTIRKWARTRWLVLFAIVAGAVLAVIAIKLLALFATAFDISFLRSAGDTTGPGAAAGAAGAGAAAGAGDPYPHISMPEQSPYYGSPGTQGGPGQGGGGEGGGENPGAEMTWHTFVHSVVEFAAVAANAVAEGSGEAIAPIATGVAAGEQGAKGAQIIEDSGGVTGGYSKSKQVLTLHEGY
jgi:hypothetical protein